MPRRPEVLVEWWEFHHPAGGRGGGGKRSQKFIPAGCCVLLFQETDGFLLSMESFPHGKDWAYWEAPGNLESKAD